MEKNFATISLNRDSRRVCAILCCVLVLFAAGVQVQRVSAQVSATQILIDPAFTRLNVGQNLTVTVNVTDDSDLLDWQVVLEYNGSVLNLTGISIPSTNVFTGHNSITAFMSSDKTAAGDQAHGSLNWTAAGNGLLGDVGVSVSNGILCTASFTAVSNGSSTVTLMTVANKVKTPGGLGGELYSYVLDSNFAEYNAFQTIGATVLVGNAGGEVDPIALFTVIPLVIDNATNFLLNSPPQVASFGVAYANYTTTFNATASYAPTGNITKYTWDFGDGNVTTVDATAPDSAYVTHIFTGTGNYTVTLTIVGKPALNAQPLNGTYTVVVYVGLILPLYNWVPFIYTVGGIMAALVVIYAARSAMRRVRRRRELGRQKILTAGPTGPPTGTQAT